MPFQHLLKSPYQYLKIERDFPRTQAELTMWEQRSNILIWQLLEKLPKIKYLLAYVYRSIGPMIKIILSVQNNFCQTFATVRRTFGMTDGMVIVNYFTCDKSTNVHRIVIVKYFTCDKSTNVYRMAIGNYFTCNISTDVHRMVIVKYFTCDKSTNMHRMVIVNYLTCDKSTNVYIMVIVKYFTCDKSTNVYRMAIVNYFTCNISTNVYKNGNC